MPTHPIIIDCDPGQDDALMLLLALGSPDDLNVLGITAVAGNVPLSLTQRNIRVVCELAGRADIPVFAGCDQPMKRPLVTAEVVHGSEGIDGMDIIAPTMPIQSQHAVDYIIETLLHADDDSITLVPTGPLTNIATAIEKAPEVLPKIKQIVLMGGAMREGGNFTPSAEFNILVDPDAADIVFNCGRPIAAFGLDVTHKLLVTKARLAQIKAINSPISTAAHGMLSYFNRHDTDKYGVDGAPLHDPSTIAYLLKPDLFKMKLCNVAIETKSDLTFGHTAVDFWHVTDRPKNTQWAYEVDADGFFDLLCQRLTRV